MGTLDTMSEEPDVIPQVCRFLKLTAPFTGPNMRDDINTILELGWRLNGIYTINAEFWAVFTRPKRQQ
jgi:hypothetical protein